MPSFGKRPPKLTIHIATVLPDDVLANRAARNQSWIDEAVEMHEATMLAVREESIEAMLDWLPSAKRG